MVEEVVELGAGLDVGFNGNIYITGYSQGGHGAMAMARAQLPEQLQDVLAVKAVAPLSGPYDMSGTQLPWILGDAFTVSPHTFLHSERMERGVRRVVRVLRGHLPGTLRSHVGHHAEWGAFRHGDQCDVSRRLTTMLLPGVMDTMTTSNSMLLDLAAQNDVHNWTPSMPLHMRYCTEDEEGVVPTQSAQTIGMSGIRSPDVEAFNLGGFNHNGCALSAITTSVLWFLSMESSASELAEHAVESECADWEYLDLTGRAVTGSFTAVPSAGWMLRRCRHTGRVEKCMHPQ